MGILDNAFSIGRQAGRNSVAAALREHWLTGVVCDHDAKTDRATCACSLWRCDPQPNVGAAVNAWIDHLLAVSSC